MNAVDDDPSVRRALRRVVQTDGSTVQTFASAGEFLDSLRRGRPVCLVLDIHLDGMSGFGLHEHLVADGTGIPWSSSQPMTMPRPTSVSKTPQPRAISGSPSTNRRCSTRSVGQSSEANVSDRVKQG